MGKNQRLWIGLDIGGTNIKAALVHADKIVKRIHVPTNAEKGKNVSLRQIQSAVRQLAGKAGGIGIGIAGIIDSKKGIVRYSPNFKGWKNVPLVSILQKEFKKPVSMINDVNAVCLGEWKYGAAKGSHNAFCFTVGTGVGGGLIINDEIVFGAHGFAGEFGHMTIDHNGPRCVCGNYGCLERYVGSQYIVKMAKKRIKSKSSLYGLEQLTVEAIARAAKKGDRTALEVFKAIGFYLGIGVANIITLLDPEVVIISGGISRSGKVLFNPIRKTVRGHSLGSQYRKCRIVPAKLGDDAGILGAVYYLKTKVHNAKMPKEK